MPQPTGKPPRRRKTKPAAGPASVSRAPLNLGGTGPGGGSDAGARRPRQRCPRLRRKPPVLGPKPVAPRPAAPAGNGDRITGCKTFFTKLHPGASTFSTADQSVAQGQPGRRHQADEYNDRRGAGQEDRGEHPDDRLVPWPGDQDNDSHGLTDANTPMQQPVCGTATPSTRPRGGVAAPFRDSPAAVVNYRDKST